MFFSWNFCRKPENIWEFPEIVEFVFGTTRYTQLTSFSHFRLIIDRAKRGLSCRTSVRHFVHVSVYLSITAKLLDRLFMNSHYFLGKRCMNPSFHWSSLTPLNKFIRWSLFRYKIVSKINFWSQSKSNWNSGSILHVKLWSPIRISSSSYFVITTGGNSILKFVINRKSSNGCILNTSMLNLIILYRLIWCHIKELVTEKINV